MLSAVAATQPWWDALNVSLPATCLQMVVSATELAEISTLQTPNQVVAVCQTPMPALPATGWILFADQIRDPGNLGTLWRIADWFGIQAIATAPQTAELWQPKTIQATMGAFLRVPALSDITLEALLATRHMPVYAAVLNGQDLYGCIPPTTGIIAIGSESHGISDACLPLTTHPLTISGRGQAESLNAAVAAGIMCSWLTRF
jgi:TrmH family RNA methyltransferase